MIRCKRCFRVLTLSGTGNLRTPDGYVRRDVYKDSRGLIICEQNRGTTKKGVALEEVHIPEGVLYSAEELRNVINDIKDIARSTE